MNWTFLICIGMVILLFLVSLYLTYTIQQNYKRISKNIDMIQQNQKKISTFDIMMSPNPPLSSVMVPSRDLISFTESESK
jgi:hypothetical protein